MAPGRDRSVPILAAERAVETLASSGAEHVYLLKGPRMLDHIVTAAAASWFTLVALTTGKAGPCSPP
jgi:hypothetical protein